MMLFWLCCAAVEVQVPPPPVEPFVVQTLEVTVHNDRAEALNGRVILDWVPPWKSHSRAIAAVQAEPGATVVVPVTYELYEGGTTPLTVTVEAGAETLATWQTELLVPDRQPPLAPVVYEPPPADAIVAVTPEHRLRRGARPWFPLGIYTSPLTARQMDELAAAGFDLVTLHPAPPAIARPLLDRLAEHRLNAWIPIGGLLTHTDDPRQRAELEQLVAGVGDHPALALWETVDEPAWGGVPARQLRAGYEVLRMLDRRRPLWTNHAPRNSISTLAWYNEATDLAGADVYPVPMPQTQSDLPNKTLGVVGDETRKNIAAVAGQKPVLMVIQAFAWKALFNRSDPAAVYPTFEQSRFMAWDATVAGAAGLLWWGIYSAPRPSPFWSDLRSAVSEMASVQDILAAAPAPVEGLAEPFRAATWPIEGDRRLLAIVNRSGDPGEATLQLPGRWRRVLGEAAVVEPAGAGLRVTLPAWGAAVLTDHPTFAPQPTRFAPEAALPVPELPRSPGNVIANPSFEVDHNGDDQPDGWDIRYPLTGVLDPTVAHTGAASLRLDAEAEGFRPLAVQTGLQVTPDRDYVLSGWMRTDSPTVKARIYVEWNDNGVYRGKVQEWLTPPADWTEYRLPFSTKGCPGGRIYVVAQCEGPGRVWFDDLAVTPVE